jgi:hypothetical protein
MNTYTETLEKVQDQLIEGIKQLQEKSLQSVAEFTERAAGLVPKTPEMTPALAPKQVIESTFGFVNRVLELQQSYLVALTEAIAPLTEKSESTKSAAKKTGKSEA